MNVGKIQHFPQQVFPPPPNISFKTAGSDYYILDMEIQHFFSQVLPQKISVKTALSYLSCESFRSIYIFYNICREIDISPPLQGYIFVPLSK